MARGHGRVVLDLPAGGTAVSARDVDYYVHRVEPGGKVSYELAGPYDRAECAAVLARFVKSNADLPNPAQVLAVKVTTVTEPVNLSNLSNLSNGEGVS
jgi:hypothetical protein